MPGCSELTYLLTYLLIYVATYLLTYLPTYLLTYLLNYSLTFLLTPWSRVLLEELTGFQPIKKFPVLLIYLLTYSMKQGPS
jgi:hypothetical protein